MEHCSHSRHLHTAGKDGAVSLNTCNAARRECVSWEAGIEVHTGLVKKMVIWVRPGRSKPLESLLVHKVCLLQIECMQLKLWNTGCNTSFLQKPACHAVSSCGVERWEGEKGQIWWRSAIVKAVKKGTVAVAGSADVQSRSLVEGGPSARVVFAAP